jgi:hypothetical protein
MLQFLVGIDPSGYKISDGRLPAAFCSQFHRLAFHAPKPFDPHLPYSRIYCYVMKGIQSVAWFSTWDIAAISRKALEPGLEFWMTQLLFYHMAGLDYFGRLCFDIRIG